MMKKATDDEHDKYAKACATPSANDTVVSDDDSAAAVFKISNNVSSSSSADNSSYSGGDDETIIESDQPLFLDIAPNVCKNCEHSSDLLLGNDVDVAGEDAAIMAEFLQDTFKPNAFDCRTRQSSMAASTLGVLNASEMDALLHAENDALMLLPEICLES